MLNSNDGNFYSYINEQIKMKELPKTTKHTKLDAVEKRLLDIVDSLRITKYKPEKDDV